MPIEFQCPYCTASIRVPDQAAGKQGKCPKCETRLIVPKLAAPPPRPAEEPNATSASSMPEAFSSSSANVPGSILPTGQFEAAPPAAFEFGGSASAVAGAPEGGAQEELIIAPTAASTPISRSLRRRQKARKSNVVIPLLFATILIGLGFAAYWYEQPKLSGELPGVELAESREAKRQSLGVSQLGLPAELVNPVMTNLADSPLPILRGSLMDVEVSSGPGELKFAVFETDRSALYRVNLGSHPAVRKFMASHGKKLEAHRQSELEAAGLSFFRERKQSLEDEGHAMDFTSLRDRFALSALVSSLGFHLEATVGSESYRCCYEDPDGNVYFLFPRGAKQFRLQGRTLPDGQRHFPGTFNVSVTQAPASSPEKKTAKNNEAEGDATDNEGGKTGTMKTEKTQAPAMMSPE